MLRKESVMLLNPSPQSRAIHFLLCSAMALLVVTPSTVFSQRLVSNQIAARQGLERAWFTQIRVDSSVNRVEQWLLDQDMLLALTSAGVIQTISTETGKTLWTTEIGNGRAAAVGMAANSKYVAVIVSGRLYIMNRDGGHHLWSRQIGGAASAAPALSGSHAYVALVDGRVEGYQLDDPSAIVWQYQSDGRIFQSPTVLGDIVSWTSDRRLLYVGQADRPRILFRVQTNEEVMAVPAEQDSHLFVGTLDGYLYSFHKSSGSEQWRYATGFAITSKLTAVGEKVYAATEGPTLHAVHALTGQPVWRAEGVKQFVASSAKHTYGIDRFGTLLVLDSQSGSVAGRLATAAGTSALTNSQSDRIFLVNDRGLAQCLHEVGATEPTWHRATTKADESMPEETEGGPGGSGTKALVSEDKKAEDHAESPFELNELESEPEDTDTFEF